jgi:hypothetical protein
LWNKTEFTCIKYGYCYSCHWKKEQVEETELRNNLKDFYLSLSKDKNKNSQKLKSQKHEENGSTTRRKAEKWGTLDALGQLAEPICTSIGVITSFHFMVLEDVDISILQTRH